MFCKHIIRLYATTSSSTTSSLATLRKKTGYTFSNCKKALQLHNNDLTKAEEWLKKQAQQLGWSKATKLEGRSTTQGLIGVIVQQNIGAMVEVNCETDFVARNENFQYFVETVSNACLKYVNDVPSNGLFTKIDIEVDTIKSFRDANGKSLEDKLALLIGTVGENATIGRAICFKGYDPIVISGHIHPTATNHDTPNKSFQSGKYGAIVALKSNDVIDEEVRKNICQHVIGMNPEKIGEKGKDEPTPDKDDEKCLIFQEYLLDTSVLVDEVLNEHNVEIIDFQRFECGKSDKEAIVEKNNFDSETATAINIHS